MKYVMNQGTKRIEQSWTMKIGIEAAKNLVHVLGRTFKEKGRQFQSPKQYHFISRDNTLDDHERSSEHTGVITTEIYRTKIPTHTIGTVDPMQFSDNAYTILIVSYYGQEDILNSEIQTIIRILNAPLEIKWKPPIY